MGLYCCQHRVALGSFAAAAGMPGGGFPSGISLSSIYTVNSGLVQMRLKGVLMQNECRID